MYLPLFEVVYFKFKITSGELQNGLKCLPHSLRVVERGGIQVKLILPHDGKGKSLWCVIKIAAKPINDILAHEAPL